MKNITLIALSLVLSACGIGGHWMEGTPGAGDNMAPYLQSFFKEGVTPEQRRADSRACGSAVTVPNGDFIAFSDEQRNAEKRPDEVNTTSAYFRLEKKWEDCMKGAMGYVWKYKQCQFGDAVDGLCPDKE